MLPALALPPLSPWLPVITSLPMMDGVLAGGDDDVAVTWRRSALCCRCRPSGREPTSSFPAASTGPSQQSGSTPASSIVTRALRLIQRGGQFAQHQRLMRKHGHQRKQMGLGVFTEVA